MPSNGDYLAATVTSLNEMRAEIVALTAELSAIRLELQSLNIKVPDQVDGRLPTLVTADGSMPVAVDNVVSVSSTQLPTNLQGGKLRVTGIL